MLYRKKKEHLFVKRVWNQNKNGTGAMTTAKNDVLLGYFLKILI